MVRNKTKPHLVLVHGAWHDSSCYDTLLPYLKKHGYDVTTVDLPSSGAEPPVKTTQPDIDVIKGTTQAVLGTGQDVVLVLHSYAGVPGSMAVEGLAKADRPGQPAVIGVVFMAAFMLDEGVRLLQHQQPEDPCGPPFHEDGDYIRHGDPIHCFYNDLDPELAKQMASKLKHHSRPTFFATVTYAAWRYVPTTYLICNNDQAVLGPWQHAFVQHAKDQGADITAVECSSGHSPFLSQPDLTARVIRRAAGEDISVSS